LEGITVSDGGLNFPSKMEDATTVKAVNDIDLARAGGFTFGSDADKNHIRIAREIFGNGIKVHQSEKSTAEVIYTKYLQSFAVMPCALFGGNFGDCAEKALFKINLQKHF
ncbi:MAG TPA: hypothetical protein DIV86_00120, partial [Alphaproteobacteria bacterium]|nr:hypothetical protein [Alphaproteobacteria bacterium]